MLIIRYKSRYQPRDLQVPWIVLGYPLAFDGVLIDGFLRGSALSWENP